MTGGDEDLRNRFSELRREELAQAPAFDAVFLGARPRPGHARGDSRPKSRLLAAAVCVAAGMTAVLWLLRPVFDKPRHEPAEVTVSITAWKAPTEFLLDTPGGELLRTVPAFGADLDYGIAPGPESRPRKRANKVLP